MSKYDFWDATVFEMLMAWTHTKKTITFDHKQGSMLNSNGEDEEGKKRTKEQQQTAEAELQTRIEASRTTQDKKSRRAVVEEALWAERNIWSILNYIN